MNNTDHDLSDVQFVVEVFLHHCLAFSKEAVFISVLSPVLFGVTKGGLVARLARYEDHFAFV